MAATPRTLRVRTAITLGRVARTLALSVVVSAIGTLGSSPLGAQEVAPPPVATRIVGVTPQVVARGEPVRIFLDGAIPNRGITAIQDIGVQVGPFAAEILRVGQGSIEIRPSDNVPAGELLPITVVGTGMRIDSSPDAYIRILRPPGLYSRILDLPWWLRTAVGIWIALLPLAAGALWVLRFRSKTSHELESLKLLRFKNDRAVEFGASVVDPSPSENPPQESSDAQAERLEIPKSLLDALSRQECTLFWGAGLSAHAGYPTWREGLNAVIEDLQSDKELQEKLHGLLRVGQSSSAVDVLSSHLGRDVLIKHFKHLWGREMDLPPHLAALGNIPFTNAVTSVWDSVIEKAFRQRDPIEVVAGSSERLDELLLKDKFCIVRLWGSFDKPKSVALTPMDYRSATAANSNYARYLATLPLTQSHLFLGASLDTIVEYLAAIPRNAHPRRHYALVPKSEQVLLLKGIFLDKYNVELMPFEASPGWPQVREFVSLLASASSLSRTPDADSELQDFILRSISVNNIGPIDDLEIELDANWNLFLGNNGAGKSTLLRAVALALCADDSRAQIEGAKLLRSGAEVGSVELVVGRNTYLVELQRDPDGSVRVNTGTRVSPIESGKWVALAFPPLRGVLVGNPPGPVAAGSSKPAAEDILPILTGQADGRLKGLKQWLVNLDVRSTAWQGVTTLEAAGNRKIVERFFDVFNAFVPGVDIRFSGVDRSTWQVNVVVNGQEVSLDQISQGTSSTLGWVGALLQRMYEIHGADCDPSDTAALVLIDEIDAHLHPEWQQRIVGALKKQFPKVQFLATTHSPLIVGELGSEQVFRLKQTKNGFVVESPDLPIQGMGVEGLLMSDMFGLSTTVDNATWQLLEKQRQLSLSDESLSDSDRSALEAINEQLSAMGFKYQTGDPSYGDYLRWRAAESGKLSKPIEVEGIQL